MEAQSINTVRRSGTLATWVQAFRLFSLTASVTPVLIGTAIAWRDGFFSTARLALALSGAVAINLGTNLINDYYDHVNGIDSAESTGSSKVIQQGLLTPRAVWWGGIAAFAIGAFPGLLLVYLCGWPVLAIGLPSVAAGYFYTAWPVGLGYAALGELTVFIFMGPVIVFGAYYVAALRFAWPPLIASIPIAFLVAAILHVNNVRDIEADLLHRKHTLANLLGRRAARGETILLYSGAYAAMLAGVLARMLPWAVLATLLTVRHARNNLKLVLTETVPAKIHPAVLGSAKLHLEFGLIMLTALVLARVLAW